MFFILSQSATLKQKEICSEIKILSIANHIRREKNNSKNQIFSSQGTSASPIFFTSLKQTKN